MDSRYRQQFKKGSLEMILLTLIGRKETYGYEILTDLNSQADVLDFAREGTVYPILYRLEKGGLIDSHMAPAKANGGMKKYYHLTDKGRKTLDELITYWQAFEECVNGYISEYQESEEA